MHDCSHGVSNMLCHSRHYSRYTHYVCYSGIMLVKWRIPVWKISSIWCEKIVANWFSYHAEYFISYCNKSSTTNKTNRIPQSEMGLAIVQIWNIESLTPHPTIQVISEVVLTASHSADTDKTRRRNWLVNSHLSLCVFVGSWWFVGGSSRQQFHWQTGTMDPPLRTERHRWILRPPQDDLRSGKWFRRHFYVVKIFTSWW